MSTARPLWWLPTLLTLGVIWRLSVGGAAPASAWPIFDWPLFDWPLFDWLGHLLAYFALVYCAGRATGRARFALVLAAWCGAALEVRQAFSGGHDVGLTDWWPALLGGLLGARACRQWQRRVVALKRHTLDTPEPLEYQDVA